MTNQTNNNTICTCDNIQSTFFQMHGECEACFYGLTYEPAAESRTHIIVTDSCGCKWVDGTPYHLCDKHEMKEVERIRVIKSHADHTKWYIGYSLDAVRYRRYVREYFNSHEEAQKHLDALMVIPSSRKNIELINELLNN